MHFCGEELAMIMASIPGFYLLSVKFKTWWHTRHFKKHHRPFQPKDCPHDHSNC